MQFKPLHALVLVLLAAGVWQFSSGVWIYAKAQLAQYLISQAWQRTLLRQAPVKPWPWADTWPVARLQWRDSVDLYVLAGINGASLPFGPGMDDEIAESARHKVVLLAGHRDTHFAFLARVQRGDWLTLTDIHGHQQIFQVTGRRVVDIRRTTLAADANGSELILVTCYPFDALRAGGPLRLVVTAVPVPLVKPHVKKEPSYGQTMVTYGMLGEKNAPHPL